VLINKNGFTLIELLITITIFAVSIAIVFGGLRVGARAWEKGEADIDHRQRNRIVLDLLKRQIKSTYLFNVEEDGEISILFKGENKSLEFVSGISLKPGSRKGLVHVKYSVQDNRKTEKKELQFFEEVNHLLAQDSEIDEEAEFKTLLPEIEELSFEYFGSLEDDEAGAWHPEWDAEQTEALPAAVKLILKTGPKTEVITVIASVSSEAVK
jgi:general secretion pathway protein J